MSFRTVVITRQSKISYKNRFMVVKNESEEKLIHLSEIDTIIVDSMNVSISAYLLKELSDNKTNIIFCDDKHNPFGELSYYYSRHNSSKKINKQIAWKQKDKDELWKKIVINKITNQSLLLNKIHSDNYNLLLSYVDEVKTGDKTNREGHVAKVYFNSLYGMNFTRHDADQINAALNYGYSILLSAMNKEVKINGYLTQLGIHHKNEFNQFNLSCDLMEPFRVIIDNFVYYNKNRKFDTEYKYDLVNLLNSYFNYCGKKYILKDIIKMFVKNTLESVGKEDEYEGFIFYEG